MARSTSTSRSADALRYDLRRTEECIDRKEFDEALRLALAVRAEAKRSTGRDSAFAAFLAAIAADMGGSPEVAVTYISEAIALDPLALPFQHSYGIIVERVRQALVAPEREAGDPTIERLHRILLNAGKADAECHVVLAKHYVATDRLDDAFKMADAITELFPACAEAWTLKREVALRLGKGDVARECDVRWENASVSLPDVNMAEANA